jgi:D-glycero-D-manno-heptose 1,7-bisphosphate phosphatase
VIDRYKKDSLDRKPNPGMLLKAADAFSIDMQESIMIGDKDSDMEAARRAGIKTRILYEPQNPSRNTGKNETAKASELIQIKKMI